MHTNIQIVWKDTKQIKSSFHFYHCHTQPKHLFLTIYVCISSDGCPVTQRACLTLYDPIDCSPPTSSVHGILQARTLEWVSVPFSRGSSQPREPVSPAVPTLAAFFTTEPSGKPNIYLFGCVRSQLLHSMQDLSSPTRD